MPSSPILPPRFPPFPQGVRLPLVQKKLSSRGKGKGRHSTRPPPHFPLEERVVRLLIFAQNHPRERTEQMNFSHETSFFAIPVDISPSEIFPLFSTPSTLQFVLQRSLKAGSDFFSHHFSMAGNGKEAKTRHRRIKGNGKRLTHRERERPLTRGERNEEGERSDLDR